MRVGLQIPSFTWPGGPARLADIARTADRGQAIFNLPDVSRITPIETIAEEIIPAVAGF